MSEPKREARRRAIVEAVKEGQPVTPETIGVSRMTLWRDLKSLDALFLAENSTEVRELKKRVGQALLENADNVLTGEIKPDVATAWRGIMSDFSELFGLNAPSRSIQAHVSANVTDRDLQLRKVTHDLDDEQFHTVVKFAASISREKPPITAEEFVAKHTRLLEGEVNDET
jgi:hypothetical protein